MGIQEFDVVEITKDVVVKSAGASVTYAPGTRAAVLEVFEPPLQYLIEFVSPDGRNVNQALVGPLDVRLVQ